MSNAFLQDGFRSDSERMMRDIQRSAGGCQVILSSLFNFFSSHMKQLMCDFRCFDQNHVYVVRWHQYPLKVSRETILPRETFPYTSAWVYIVSYGKILYIIAISQCCRQGLLLESAIHECSFFRFRGHQGGIRGNNLFLCFSVS